MTCTLTDPTPRAGITPQANWINYARLAFGVTTIHDPSNDTHSIFAASEMAKAGQIVAPRTFSTGTILYGATGSYKAEIEGLEDAKFHLRRMQAVGAFSVKSYNQPRRDQRQQVVEAARELGMMVVPEGGSTFMHNMTMIVDGHTGIEHTLAGAIRLRRCDGSVARNRSGLHADVVRGLRRHFGRTILVRSGRSVAAPAAARSSFRLTFCSLVHVAAKRRRWKITITSRSRRSPGKSSRTAVWFRRAGTDS